MKQLKTGFTMVELLVVMSIIGLLIGLGVAGLLQLRRMTEADQAGKNLISALKTTQSLAKNNSINLDEVNLRPAELTTNIFAYKLYFDGTTVTRSLCHRLFADPWRDSNLKASACTPNPGENLQLQSFGDIALIPDPSCNTVLMENLTGKMSFYKTNGTVTATAPTLTQCKIIVHLKDINMDYNKLVFDLTDASFTIRAN